MLPRQTVLGFVVAVGAAALASLGSNFVAAEETSKFYAGVGLGITDFASDHAGIEYGDTSVGWQLHGGFQTTERAAVEVAVERLAVDSEELLGSGVERLQISAEHSSLIARGVYSLSLQEVLRRGQKIAVFGAAGIARLREERNVLETITSRSISVSETDTALVLSVGATFEIARVRLRTYLQSTDRAEHDLNSLGVAAEFRF